MAFSRHRFHLIGNAHLDPVWLWDWKEGFNEAINTTRAMLDLMDEFPDLTVVRGESALYAFVEREEPALFERLRAQVQAGRWEVVGGTVIQSDNNLPATAVLLRQFECGQAYFESRFGRRTDTAWFPDSFGHSAGLPEILAASGIQNFAHCRPFAAQMPLAQPAYWWEGSSGARILAYRSPVDWYCNERHTLVERLDAYLAEAQRCDLQNIAVFYGLGNHGGGPTRRMLHELTAWAAAHPEVECLHSGLSPYFAAVRSELAARPELALPVVRGELGYCLRGCYVSTAKIKHPYRRTEQAVLRAEKIRSLTLAGGADPSHDAGGLDAPWDAVLFNTFHDILPGSSIERACDQQVAQLGGAQDAAERCEFAALNAFARTLDTSVPPPEDDKPGAVAFLVFNPQARPYRGPVEFEAQLDWRPLREYGGARVGDVPIEVLGADGRPRTFQRIAPENRAMTDLVWRVRLVVPVDLGPGGWEVLTVQYREVPQVAPLVEAEACHAATDLISNEGWTVAARIGAEGVKILRWGMDFLDTPGLTARVYHDPYGAWGGLFEEEASYRLTEVREQWRVTDVRVLEAGPVMARLWVRLAGERSRLDLTFSLYSVSDVIRVAGRLFLDETSARVKLVLPGWAPQACFEVPGGVADRGDEGEVSGVGWVCGRRRGDDRDIGFASDVLTGFSLDAEGLTVSLARASRYADDVPTAAGTETHRPVVDCGELRFNALLSDDMRRLPEETTRLKQPVIVLPVPASPGPGPRTGALLAVAAPVEVLALRPVADGELELTLQNQSPTAVVTAITLLGRAVPGPMLAPQAISRVRLQLPGHAKSV